MASQEFLEMAKLAVARREARAAALAKVTPEGRHADFYAARAAAQNQAIKSGLVPQAMEAPTRFSTVYSPEHRAEELAAAREAKKQNVLAQMQSSHWVNQMPLSPQAASEWKRQHFLAEAIELGLAAEE